MNATFRQRIQPYTPEVAVAQLVRGYSYLLTPQNARKWLSGLEDVLARARAHDRELDELLREKLEHIPLPPLSPARPAWIRANGWRADPLALRRELQSLALADEGRRPPAAGQSARSPQVIRQLELCGV